MDPLLAADSSTDRLLMHNRLRRAFPKAQIAIADDPINLPIFYAKMTAR